MNLKGRLIKDCVTGLNFNAAHYTPVNGELLLHGHTFGVSVCVEGPSGPLWVVDFIELRKFTEELIKSFNYSFLVPRQDLTKITFNAPFTLKLKDLDCTLVTAECVATHICSELKKSYISQRVIVTVEEGVGNKATVEC